MWHCFHNPENTIISLWRYAWDSVTYDKFVQFFNFAHLEFVIRNIESRFFLFLGIIFDIYT